MARVLCILLLVVAASSLAAQKSIGDQSASPKTDREHTEWIVSVLRSVDAIQPGMTREELSSMFIEEGGGPWSRSQRAYVFRQCPYIKIDVKFAPVPKSGPSDELPQDRIVEISKPYLQYFVSD
jgi:hypothetical protein